MTNVIYGKFVSSALIVFLSVLAGCAKPSEGSDTTVPTSGPPPSTSANPLKAIAENEKADAAVDVFSDKLSATERDSIALKRVESIKAASMLFNGDTVVAQASSPEGTTTEVGTVVTVQPPVSAASAPSVQQSASQAATVIQQGASEAASAAAPVAARAASAVAQAAAGMANQAATAASGIAPAAPAAIDDAAKRELILAAIEPVMRLNAAIYRERFEVTRIRDKIAAGKEPLYLSESDWLMRIKTRYQLDASENFDALLARVDGVKLPFLIAPLALGTDWKSPQTDLKKMFADRIEVLNTSSSEENVRFRTARASSNAGNQTESTVLMQAFLGIDPSIVAINEINRVSDSDPAVKAKIQQIYQALIGEVKK